MHMKTSIINNQNVSAKIRKKNYLICEITHMNPV